MKTYIARTTGDASHDHTNESSKKKGYIDSPHQFADNRTEAIAQRKLQQLANNSQQAERNEQVQTMADLHTSQQKPTLRRKKNNTGLPDQLKTGIEDLSGYSMDDVNVHYNSNQPAQLNAYAYAQGTDIYLAPGQEKHLPHEAWHVIQQKQGRVKATMQMKEVQINDDEGLEMEADIKGEQARNGVIQAKKLPALKSESKVNSTTIQKRERDAVVVWDITHEVIPNDKESLLGDGPDPFENEGIELYRDDRIIVDDEDIFQSRRGANQEKPDRRESDQEGHLTKKWLKLLRAAKGGASGNGYVREETVTINKEKEESRKITTKTVNTEQAKEAGDTIHGAWNELRRKRRMSTGAWEKWESIREEKGKDSSPSWDQIEEGYDVSKQLSNSAPDEYDNYDKEEGANQAIITAYDGQDNVTPIGIIVIEKRATEKYPHDKDNEDNRWYLRWLIGHPMLKGAGGKLLDQALKHVSKAGGKAVWVQSAPSAKGWYESKEFNALSIKQQEEYDPAFEEGWDSVLMVRFL